MDEGSLKKNEREAYENADSLQWVVLHRRSVHFRPSRLLLRNKRQHVYLRAHVQLQADHQYHYLVHAAEHQTLVEVLPHIYRVGSR